MLQYAFFVLISNLLSFISIIHLKTTVGQYCVLWCRSGFLFAFLIKIYILSLLSLTVMNNGTIKLLMGPLEFIRGRQCPYSAINWLHGVQSPETERGDLHNSWLIELKPQNQSQMSSIKQWKALILFYLWRIYWTSAPGIFFSIFKSLSGKFTLRHSLVLFATEQMKHLNTQGSPDSLLLQLEGSQGYWE